MRRSRFTNCLALVLLATLTAVVAGSGDGPYTVEARLNGERIEYRMLDANGEQVSVSGAATLSFTTRSIRIGDGPVSIQETQQLGAQSTLITAGNRCVTLHRSFGEPAPNVSTSALTNEVTVSPAASGTCWECTTYPDFIFDVQTGGCTTYFEGGVCSECNSRPCPPDPEPPVDDDDGFIDGIIDGFEQLVELMGLDEGPPMGWW